MCKPKATVTNNLFYEHKYLTCLEIQSIRADNSAHTFGQTEFVKMVYALNK